MDRQPTVGDHISVSRVRRYAQCPRAYALHYIEKKPALEGSAPRFGKVLHAALERTYKRIVNERYVGRFPIDWLIAAYKHEAVWAGATDVGEFDEGLAMLKDYAAAHPTVDYSAILGIEQEFRLAVGRYTVLGYIDRVDVIDHETVEVIDYKSNRLLFSREDVENDLQLSIYALAARKLWPWAKKVRLTFYMLRHGVRLETSRTDEALATACEYVAAIGQALETSKEYPARLNANCAYCDHRFDCPEYARVLRGEVNVGTVDAEDLVAVSRSRQQIAHTLKILNARKDELDKLIKAKLDEQDALVLAGVRYSMFDVESRTYPLRRTIDLVSVATGAPKTEVASQIAVIDKDALNDLLKSASKQLPRERAALLKAELDAIADRTVSQRLWAKELS
jgi:RecB family exonuclease